MRRRIAALRPWWDRLLLLAAAIVAIDLTTALVPGLPDVRPPGGVLGIGVVVALFVVCTVLTGIAPRADHPGPVELVAPVRGRWVSMNGPGQKLPSHGTRTRGQYGAIDVCGPTDATSPRMVRMALRSSRPEEFAWFGEPVPAMAGGTVVRVRDGYRDHRARNTWQALAFMMTLEGVAREMGGTGRVLGNHVVVAHDDGTFAAYAHLRRGSATVREGAVVEVGDVLGEIGNTGNTSMPHLHVQLMDRAEVDAAAGIPMRWTDIQLTGELDEQLKAYAKDPASSALPGMPRNGETFVTVSER